MKDIKSASIFSWHPEQLTNPREMLVLLDQFHIDQIFQYVPLNEEPRKIQRFLNQAEDAQKSVYFLAGEAEWALDEEATEAIHYIEWAAMYRSRIKGIVLDIEPHTLKAFKKNPKPILFSFVKCLQAAYACASKNELEVIVCLPYYLDTLGHTDVLEAIIREGTDAVAVMNYYRDKEIEHLETEARLSDQYAKPLYTIYELQPPGKHGLTDQNTYYNYGLQAVYENYRAVEAAYPKQAIRCSFHEFRSFKELAEKVV